MEIIKVSPYEKAYLIRILEKQKNICLEEFKKKIITKEMYEMEMKQINDLINRTNGKYQENLIVRRRSDNFV